MATIAVYVHLYQRSNREQYRQGSKEQSKLEDSGGGLLHPMEGHNME